MAMNDFNIGFIGGLDGTKSKAKLNQDIDAINKTLKELELKAKLDPNQVKSLETQLNTLKVNLTDAKFSQSALDGMVSQINNALKGIKIPSVNVGGNANIGQQIGNNIAQGVKQGISQATSAIKSFDKLTDSMQSQKISFNNDGLQDTKTTLDAIKNTYAEFGQVKITNKVFNGDELQSFKVNIEQVNGELKETRSFMMKLSDNKQSFILPDDVIKGTEKYVQHLNAAKNATNATGEALNAQNQRLAEQAKYYGKIKEETNHLYSLKQKLLSADELQTAELNKQIKSTKQRITYNNQQIDKKGLRDDSLTREINDLIVAREKQLALSNAKAQDVANTKAQARAQQEANAVLKEQQALQEQVNKIQLSFDDGTYEAKYDSLIAKTRQWINANDESVISTQRLTTAYNEFNQAATAYAKDGSVANRDKLIQKEEELARQIKATTNEVKSYNAEYAKSSKIDSLHQKIQEFYDKNTASHRTWGAQLRNMLDETAHGAQLTATRVNEIEQEFLGVGNAARQAGKLGLSFFDSVKQQASKFVQWVSITDVVMEGAQAVRKMVTEVRELDTAMTSLYKVTNETDATYDKFLNNATKSAKELGATITDIVNSTADFAKLGYSLDDASALAEVATIYKNVGDIDIESATESIVSTMAAFGYTAEEAMSIIDKFNQVGNNFSISSADIGEALQRSAASLATSGNTLDESIALITAGNTIIQDADTVGTALKTVSLRLTSTTAELEAMGEETEYACETLSDYRNLVLGLTDNKVDILGDDGEYKNTYNILKEISAVFEDMSSMEQSSLLKSLFGVRQANIGASLLTQFATAEDVLESSINSAGSAIEENEKYLESIDGKVQQFEASFQSLSKTIVDSDLIKGIVDFGTTTITWLDKVIDKFGTLPTLMATVGAGLGIKNVGAT